MSLGDLIEKFRGVALDRVETMSVLLVEVEADPQPEKVETLTREIHTLKGEAKMMGFADVNLVSHLTEHILLGAAAVDFDVRSDIIDLILEGFDVLSGLLTKSPAGMSAPVDLAGFVDRVAAARGAAELVLSDQHEEVSPQPDRVPTGEYVRPERTTSVTDGSLLRIQTSGSMRVELAKLERLGEQSGEVVLSSRRLNYQLGALERVRDEFDSMRDAVEPMLPKSHLARVRAVGREIEGTLAELRTEFGQVEAWSSQLDGQIRDLRHTSLASALQHYPRAVRDLASARGKAVRLDMDVSGVEVDQLVLNALAEPLLHLVRNAVDHGIEPPEEREQLGKPRDGTIQLTAHSAGDSVRVVLRDDGQGIDAAAIAQKAIEREMLTAKQVDALHHDDLIALIFEAGFSTRDEVTDVSGRGIGMDVVRRQISGIGGNVEIESSPGEGTTFTLTLPISSTVGSVLTFVLDGARYGLPSKDVERVEFVDYDQLDEHHSAVSLSIQDAAVPLLDWTKTLDDFSRKLPRGRLTVVVIQRGKRRVALWVDDVTGERDAMTRPLPDFLAGVQLCRGVAITEAGELIPLLEVGELLNPDRLLSAIGSKPSIRATMELPSMRAKRRILVVEDSEVTRALVTSILRGAGFEVVQAEDGWFGWQTLQNGRFDLVLTDVQMPRMTGLELLERVRSDPRFARTPVVILTTLGEAGDKARAMNLGASGYLVKLNFQESELLQTVRRFLR